MESRHLKLRLALASAIAAASRAAPTGVFGILNGPARLVAISSSGSLVPVGPEFGNAWGYVANGLTAVDDAGHAILAVAWSAARGHTLLTLSLATGAVLFNASLPLADVDKTIGRGMHVAFDAVGGRAVVGGALAAGGAPWIGTVAVGAPGAAWVPLADVSEFAPAVPTTALAVVVPGGGDGAAARVAVLFSSTDAAVAAVVVVVDLETGRVTSAPTATRVLTFAWDAAGARAVGLGLSADGSGFAVVAIDVATGVATWRGNVRGLPVAVTYDESVSSAFDARYRGLYWLRTTPDNATRVELVATRVSDAAELSAVDLP